MMAINYFMKVCRLLQRLEKFLKNNKSFTFQIAHGRTHRFAPTCDGVTCNIVPLYWCLRSISLPLWVLPLDVKRESLNLKSCILTVPLCERVILSVVEGSIKKSTGGHGMPCPYG